MLLCRFIANVDCFLFFFFPFFSGKKNVHVVEPGLQDSWHARVSPPPVPTPLVYSPPGVQQSHAQLDDYLVADKAKLAKVIGNVGAMAMRQADCIAVDAEASGLVVEGATADDTFNHAAIDAVSHSNVLPPLRAEIGSETIANARTSRYDR